MRSLHRKKSVKRSVKRNMKKSIKRSIKRSMKKSMKRSRRRLQKQYSVPVEDDLFMTKFREKYPNETTDTITNLNCDGCLIFL